MNSCILLSIDSLQTQNYALIVTAFNFPLLKLVVRPITSKNPVTSVAIVPGEEKANQTLTCMFPTKENIWYKVHWLVNNRIVRETNYEAQTENMATVYLDRSFVSGLSFGDEV